MEDAVKSQCAGRSDIQNGKLGANGWWLSCKGESHVVTGSKIITTLIAAAAPHDKGYFDCHHETDRDPEAALAACKSIRKK
jgi:hypothetical protein